MAVPKRKVSKSRRDKRKANWKISVPSIVECPHCHEMFNVFGSVYEAPKGTISDYEITAEPIQ